MEKKISTKIIVREAIIFRMTFVPTRRLFDLEPAHLNYKRVKIPLGGLTDSIKAVRL
jgi:hypothetical protein